VKQRHLIAMAIGGVFVVSGDAWHSVTLKSRTTLHYVSFDGTALFSVRGGTFPDAGEVALWTKADRATYSDTISITPLRLIEEEERWRTR
jgi:hypothetical protein